MKHINRSTMSLAIIVLCVVASSAMAQSGGNMGGLTVQSENIVRSAYDWMLTLAPWIAAVTLVVAFLAMRWAGFSPILWIVGGVAGIAAIPLIINGVGLVLR